MGLQNREGALYYATGLDTSGLIQGRQQSIGILRGMASQVSKLDVFAGLAISGSIAFKRLAVDAKRFSEEFEQSMREVLTISSALQTDFTGYSDMIVDMSRELPQSANALAKAYYQIVSAGYDGAGGLELLEQASRAAVGGVTDVTTAADGMTTVLNAWNLTAEQSSAVADTFFTAVRLGKTTFGEMAASISQAAPLAAAYGISFNEIAASLATITKQGTTTNMAVTQIRQAIVSLNEVLGDGWSEMYTFQEALVEVTRQAEASGKSLKEYLGGRVEALMGVLALTGKNAKVAAQDLEEFAKAAGASDDAYQRMIKSSINQSKLLKNNLDAALKPLGDWVANKSTGFARAMNDAFATGQIEEYVRYVKIATVSLTAYALTANGAALSTKIMRKAIDLASLSMNKLRLAFANNPIGMIALGVTAAVTAFTAYNDKVNQTARLSAKLTESVSNDIFSLNSLFTKLKTAEKGTEDWNRAREMINSRYGTYLKNLIDEKTALEDIEAAQKRVTEALIANAGVKIYSDELTSELNKYQKRFENELGEFTQAFSKAKGADRLPEFIIALNEAVSDALESGSQKTKEGMQKQVDVATKIWNEFLADVYAGERGADDAAKDFLEGFLDVAKYKENGGQIIDYLQGMIDTYSGMLNDLSGGREGNDFIGPLPYDYDSLSAGNYYEDLQKKISETEDQLKDLAGAQGEMDLVAIAAKKELLQQYNAELAALELLLGLREKEKQEATKQAPAGSILGVRQEIEALNQQYVEATTQAARESLKDQIEVKEQELEVIQGVIDEEVKLYEDYYSTIEDKGFKWLQTELDRLKKLRDAKKQAFEAGEDLSEEEKKKIVEDIEEVDSKIRQLTSLISTNLRDALQIMSDGFNTLSNIVGEVDERTGKMINNIGRVATGIGQIALGVSTGDAVTAASGLFGTIEAMAELQRMSDQTAKQYAERLDEINRLIEKQQRLIDTDRTGDKAAQIRELIALYNQYADTLQEQIELEKKKERAQNNERLFGFIKLPNNKSKVPELEQELEDLNATMEELGVELGDTLAGGITQSDMAGIISDQLREAEGEIKDFANVTQRILESAIFGVFESSIMRNGLTDMQNYLAEALADETFTDSERREFESLVEQYGQKWNAIAEQLNISNLLGSATEDVNSLSGAIRRSLTEETGGIIAGTMNALRLDVREMKGFQFEMVGHLQQIVDNTSFNRRLEDIYAIMGSLQGALLNNAS